MTHPHRGNTQGSSAVVTCSRKGEERRLHVQLALGMRRARTSADNERVRDRMPWPSRYHAPSRTECMTMAKLYFYYSAMNAGKTTTLLQGAYNYRERGMRTLILTPALDNRYGEGVVASRIGLKANALRFGGGEDLLARVDADIAAHGALHCVFVDEAQFLTRAQVWQLSDVVDKLGIPALAYGLRTDFRGELFEGSRYLLAWADHLEEIKTICHSGRKATMVVRVDELGRAVTDGPQVEIGGNERYVSVSRAEFKKISQGNGRIELQQSVLPLGESH